MQKIINVCKVCGGRIKLKLLGSNDGIECICESCGNSKIFNTKELLNETEQAI